MSYGSATDGKRPSDESIIAHFTPGGHAFMLFAMLLLGIFAAALVASYEVFALGIEHLTRLLGDATHKDGLVYTFAMVVILALTTVGFLAYLASFFVIALPFRLLSNGSPRFRQLCSSALFEDMANQAIAINRRNESFNATLPIEVKDAFMFQLLTSVRSESAHMLRFFFTQIMFARTIGTIVVFFSVYVVWRAGWNWEAGFGCVVLTLCLAIGGYAAGVKYFRMVMANAYAIQPNGFNIDGQSLSDRNARQPNLD